MTITRQSHRRSVRAVLLSLVVGILSMSLVVTLPSVAEAATNYGATAEANVAAGTGAFSLGCDITAAKAISNSTTPNTSWIRYTANCDRNAALASEMAVTIGSLTVAVVFQGSTSAGAACSYTGSWSGVDSPGNASSTPNDPTCAVGSVCLDWHLDEKFYPDPDASQTCVPMPIPEPAGFVTGTCATFSASQPVPHPDQAAFYGSWPTNTLGEPVDYSITALQSRTDKFVHLYVVTTSLNDPGSVDVTPLDGATGYSIGPQGAASYINLTATGTLNGTQLPWVNTRNGQEYINAGLPTTAGQYQINRPVVGYGYYLDDVGGTATTNPVALPQVNSLGKLGLNNPGACEFYWGQKIASTPSDNYDEPQTATNLGATPPPDNPPDTNTGGSASTGDAGCGFSISDPTTWASAGICQLVGLIHDLISAIGHIAGDMASAILGGLGNVLQDLLVPANPPSFSDVHLTMPDGWVPSMPALSDGTCGAVTLPSLSLGHLAGASPATTLFNTCDDPWPNVRTFTYWGLLALGMVTIVRATFRMIMASVGMGVEVGAGGDDE